MRKIENIVGRRDPMTLTTRDLMQDELVTSTPNTSAVTVALRLCDGNFGSIPIVDERRALLGLVSEFDLLNVIQQRKDLRKLTAEQIMTRSVHTATEDMPLASLIDHMQSHHLIRLPVVRDDQLVGIVARRDVVYGYLLSSFGHEGAPPAR